MQQNIQKADYWFIITMELNILINIPRQDRSLKENISTASPNSELDVWNRQTYTYNIITWFLTIF